MKSAETPRARGGLPWVVVADHGRARLLRAFTAKGPLEEVEDYTSDSARIPEGALRSGVQGRPEVHRVPGGLAHSAGHADDPARHEAGRRFAGRIAHRLEHLREQGAVCRLYLVAEPHFLGLLREALPDQVLALVATEIGSEMTTRTPAQIRDHLPKML